MNFVALSKEKHKVLYILTAFPLACYENKVKNAGSNEPAFDVRVELSFRAVASQVLSP